MSRLISVRVLTTLCLSLFAISFPQSGSTINYATYTSTTCTGTATNNPLPKQACQCGDSSCSSYYNGFYYLPSIPSISGQVMTVTAYAGSNCDSGSVMYVSIQPTSYCYSTPCTKSSSTGSAMSYSYSCSGSSTGTVTNGYAVASATYATSDTTCTSTPLSATYYKLGVCMPSGTTGGQMFTADAKNKIYYASYDSTTCSGDATANYQDPSTSCAATATGRSSNFTYSMTYAQPSSGQVVTFYTGAGCKTGTEKYISVTANVPTCVAASCQSGSTYSYKIDCPSASASTVTVTPAPGAGSSIAGIGPTVAPTLAPSQGSTVQYVYVVVLVLVGVTPDKITPEVMTQLQIAIATALPGVAMSDITFEVVTAASRRRLTSLFQTFLQVSVKALPTVVKNAKQVVTAMQSSSTQGSIGSAVVS